MFESCADARLLVMQLHDITTLQSVMNARLSYAKVWALPRQHACQGHFNNTPQPVHVFQVGFPLLWKAHPSLSYPNNWMDTRT